jgi:hypothetical protein
LGKGRTVMDVHTVRKDFLSALDPNEKFVYEDVSDLIFE